MAFTLKVNGTNHDVDCDAPLRNVTQPALTKEVQKLGGQLILPRASAFTAHRP
jgi:hypothetical protein